jgi:hypothetical protein
LNWLSSQLTANPNSLLGSEWLDSSTQVELRAALRGSKNLWFDSSERRGFMRTIFDPLNEHDDVPRTRFLMAARKSAEAAGLPPASHTEQELRRFPATNFVH